MEANEAAAIAQARAGDPEAFRVLVELHSRALFRLTYRMTGHEQDAEDLVQETFLRAWRRIRRFDARSKFSTWLHVIATNCCLDLLRSRGRRQKSEQAMDPVDLAGLAAIRNLGLAGKRWGEHLVSIYDADQDKSVRSAVIHALFLQNNVTALIAIARKETNPELKREAVQKLSLMRSKEATEFMMELLNK